MSLSARFFLNQVYFIINFSFLFWLIYWLALGFQWYTIPLFFTPYIWWYVRVPLPHPFPFPSGAHPHLVQVGDPWALLCPFTYLLHVFSLIEFISEKPINHSSSVIKHLQCSILEALWALWDLSRWAARSLILAFLFLTWTLGVHPLLSPHHPLCLWPSYLPGVIVQKFLRWGIWKVKIWIFERKIIIYNKKINK